MFNGYELNSVELNASVVSPLDAEGDISALALLSATELVTRNAIGLADAVSLLSGTAYPIRPSSGHAGGTAWINAIIAHAIRKASGDALTYSFGRGFLEGLVTASGYAIATATLLGIPADELGSGNALASATLVSAGNRVKIDSGLMLSVCTASNSTFDVVRNAYSNIVGTAFATGEPAVGVKKDASGSLSCSASVTGAAFVDSLLEGHATVAAYATGHGDIHFSTTGNASPVAIAIANATLLAKAEGDSNATAVIADTALRTANSLGNAIASGNSNFARVVAKREGGAIASGVAIISGSAMKFITPKAKASASATVECLYIRTIRNSHSSATATATAVGTGFANARSLAPDERTLFIRTAGIRIITVRQELREIRVTA